MPRDGELSLNEREFLLQLLQEGVRADDRPLDAYRQVQLCFGDDYGAVDVRLGKTR